MCVHVFYEILSTGYYSKCAMNIPYAAFGIDGAMYMLDMRFCVHIMLWICDVVYIWCYVHVHAVLCTYGVMCMLYIWYYVHMVLCE